MKKVFRLSAVILLVMALLVPMFAVSASAESLEEKSVEIKSGVAISHQYYSQYAETFYKINVSESGELKLSFDNSISLLFVTVYDYNGEKVCYTDRYAEVGEVEWDSWSDCAHFSWNANVERQKGFYTYHVNKGTYYIEVQAWYLGNGKLKMTAEFPSSGVPATKSIRLKITLNKGQTLRLGAILTPENAEPVKWSSSKKSVATVSKTGKVKAIAKGTATITCKSGDRSIKITLVVQ